MTARRFIDATREAARTRAARMRAEVAGLYRPPDERDACGVGLVAAVDGRARREIVTLALEALKNVWHRGAVDADGLTGDGAGLRLDVPDAFFREQVARTGHDPRPGPIGVGMVFLPRTDFGAQEAARTIVESEILREGLYIYGWRHVPVRPGVIGAKAESCRPEIEQILLHDPQSRDFDALEKVLYIVRRRIERRALEAGVDAYICSLSTRTLVYKGMFLAEQIEAFYPDLADEGFTSRAAVFHQRYSTNTFPEWRLAQPFRMLAHNGEINTVKGNINWMTSHEIGLARDAFGENAHEVRPIIQRGSSDSAALDQAFEALVRAGREAPLVKALMMPEAWSKREGRLPPARRALYAYGNAMMEPWDGPAAIAACDGRWAIAGVDRNGLRPARWARTHDGILAVGSEAGMCPLDDARIARRGNIPPGGMIGVDLLKGEDYEDDTLIDHIAASHPFEDWAEGARDLEQEIIDGPEPVLFDASDRRRRCRSAGITHEDLEVVLAPMIDDSKEAIGSMGDDTPLAILSDEFRPLSHYFRQNFSQVTNPPIDPLREGRVMSLRTRFQNLGALRASDGPLPEVFSLEGPVLTNGMYDRLTEILGPATHVIDCTFPSSVDEPGAGAALRSAIDRIKDQAIDAVEDGATHLVLTDEDTNEGLVGAPMILAAAGVHRLLLETGRRRKCAITIRSAECLDPHYCAVLIGVGATCVNPYLAFETGADRIARGLHPGQTAESAARRIKEAFEAGLLKIISKMGISVLSAYRGACNFETLGLSRTLAEEFFPGTPSRISGMGLPGVELNILERHAAAWTGPDQLDIGGFYKQRASGEAHAIEATVVRSIQDAVQNNDEAAYRRYVEALKSQPPIQLRDLFRIRPLKEPTPIYAVESANEIRKRFVTPGMSLGALSPEAHGALNIAMNRIGARSVSGEGGEDPDRYTPLPNGDNANSAVKQIASGRFGVTAEYLNQCKEIEIKVAQGAKPGEGGQLPGFKVNAFIAKMRHATEGVTLISPPPHHDIYSIEDLAQLIYDLKQINPDARVCVKLVAKAGVGAIAAGVAKAKADVILISGNVGGTGASPQTSIKFAGAPWEIGLSEAHQILSLNNLRDQVRLRVDGGLRTARDIIVGAMLGAEEFGVGTISLVAMGCLMVRQCHSNTCPVGVCTQDEALREHFVGKPEHIVHLMTFLADEVREHLAELGASRLDDIVGRTDLLDQFSRGADHLDDLDLNPLLVRVDPAWRPTPRQDPEPRQSVPDSLDIKILHDATAVFERNEKMQLTYPVNNVDRAIGARISSHIVRAKGAAGFPDGQLTVRLKGSAGQSLGAFSASGLRLEVIGEANDYVGKGLSGAIITVSPRAGAHAGHGPNPDVVIGNTCLYGATSGALYACGQAGERFAVRNSGANAVVEGVSANACEYMTGGAVVILGPVGDNFGAGMTGGEAFVYDPDLALPPVINPDTILVGRFTDHQAAERCRALVVAHHDATGSAFAKRLIDNWEVERERFVHVVPKEIAAREGLALPSVA